MQVLDQEENGLSVESHYKVAIEYIFTTGPKNKYNRVINND